DGHAQAGEVAVLASAAVLLRGREAHQPEAAHLLHDVGREVVVLVPLRGVRGDLRLGELADAAAELLVLARHLERHGAMLTAEVNDRYPSPAVSTKTGKAPSGSNGRRSNVAW